MDLSWLIRVVEVVIGIGLVIFVHELGHFLAAKAVGIRVERFSLGFPPRLVGFRRGDTDYCISAIPLGGYVKMAGEDPDEPSTIGASDTFTSKTVGQRALVISAGVIMNVIFALVGFLIAFKVGVEMNMPVVGSVLPGSGAQGQLERGDVIVGVEGQRPLDFVDVAVTAAFADGDIELEVLRDGERRTVRVQARRDLGQQIQRIGVAPIEQVATVKPGSAAERAGLRRGDRIVSVEAPANGPGSAEEEHRRVGASLQAIQEVIYQNPETPLRLHVQRGDHLRGTDERLTLELAPEPRQARTLGLTLADTPVVGFLTRGAPAERAGLQLGDIVRAVDGEPATVETIVEQIKAAAAADDPLLRLEVERRGARETLEVRPEPAPGGGPVIGAGFGKALVEAVAPGSPADEAGIAPGALLLRLDGQAVSLPQSALLERIASLREPGDPIELAWLGVDGEERKASLEPAPILGESYGHLGASFAMATFVHQAAGILEPVMLGFQRTWMFMEQVFLTLQGMFTRKIDTTTLGGPIMIGTFAYEVTARGLGTLLYFLCIISINLAILNALPIPVLDGGHLVFLLAERIKGSPVHPIIQIRAQQIGLLMLVALMLYVTRNDILRLIHG